MFCRRIMGWSASRVIALGLIVVIFFPSLTNANEGRGKGAGIALIVIGGVSTLIGFAAYQDDEPRSPGMGENGRTWAPRFWALGGASIIGGVLIVRHANKRELGEQITASGLNQPSAMALPSGNERPWAREKAETGIISFADPADRSPEYEYGVESIQRVRRWGFGVTPIRKGVAGSLVIQW